MVKSEDIAKSLTLGLIPIPYFLGYKTEELFSFQNSPRNLDKRDLVGLFRKGTTHSKAKFQRTELAICSHSREGKSVL